MDEHMQHTPEYQELLRLRAESEARALATRQAQIEKAVAILDSLTDEERATALAPYLKAERERAAKIVDDFWPTGRASDLDKIAAAIRALRD